MSSETRRMTAGNSSTYTEANHIGSAVGTREMLQLANPRYALCTSLLGATTLPE